MHLPPVLHKVRIDSESSNDGTDYRESTYWSRTLIAVVFAGVILATIFFLLRLFCRTKTNWKLATEDLFMGVGLVFSYGLSTCIIIGKTPPSKVKTSSAYHVLTIAAAYNGVGYQIWALPQQVRGRVALVFWLGQKFWSLAHGFTKLSIILLIHHLFGGVGRRRWRATMLAFICFTIAWTITAVLGNAFQCLPPRYFWTRSSMDGHCRSSDEQRAFSFTIGSLSLAEDLALLAVPMAMVWRLQLARAKKIRVVIMFGLGGLVCIISILRLVELIHFQTDNITGSGAMQCIWASLEINLGIICSSLVLMRPLYRECRVCLGKCVGRNKESSGAANANESMVDGL